jgi:hypothetical protein
MKRYCKYFNYIYGALPPDAGNFAPLQMRPKKKGFGFLSCRCLRSWLE